MSPIEARYESGKAALAELAAWNEKHVTKRQRNEATTRLHLINTLLLDVLGWPKEDCEAEQSHEGQYVDYALGRPFHRLIVEAKKEGDYFELPSGWKDRVCRIRTLIEGNKNLASAIRQVSTYCQQRGVPLAVVCNGHQIVVLMGSRQDGVPPIEGNAIVFTTLEEMVENFKELWDCLSKPAVEALAALPTLNVQSQLAPPEKLAHRIVDYPGLRRRNDLQTELRILGSLFLYDITNEPQLEQDFIRECYCRSDELSSYALVSRDILRTRYSLLFQRGSGITASSVREGADLSPTLTSDALAAGLSRRPLILLGDVGVGKTMFVRHLINVDAKPILKNAIVLYVDFGREPALADDLKTFVVRRFRRSLLEEFNIDIEQDAFVRNVYAEVIDRFATGIWGSVRVSDPQAYEGRIITLLSDKIAQEDEHLRASLELISSTERRQVVIFLDNIDQRPFNFQEDVFLISHSLAQTWPASVFVALRPETFNRSRLEGSLTGYQPRTFAVGPPRIDQVISKRLRFSARQLETSEQTGRWPDRMKEWSATLAQYLKVLIHSFRYNRELAEFVDNLSGGNVRVALEFLGTFIGSGHVDTEKILGIASRTGGYTIALHEFMRAVIYGDYEHYSPTASPVPNLFDISAPDGREHFLLPALLQFIESTGPASGPELFVRVQGAYAFAQGFGFQPSQIQFALDRADRKGLLEFSPLLVRGHPDARCRITTVGAYCYKRLISSMAYVDAVIVDTPIVDATVKDKILDVTHISERLARAEVFRGYLNDQWARMDRKGFGFDWAASSELLAADMVRASESAKRAAKFN